MRFKMIILLTILVAISYSTKSQSDGVSLRFHSGLNVQTFYGTNITGEKLDLSFVPRFNVGVMIDFPIASKLYLKSGLLFTTKGAKSKGQLSGFDMGIEYNIAYIELPINILYKSPLGSGHVLIGTGPYLSHGILGNVDITTANTTVNEKNKFANQYESMNPIELNKLTPIDYGENLFFGYEFKRKILMQFNAQVGMAKVNAKNMLFSSKVIIKNKGYGLSIEYKF